MSLSDAMEAFTKPKGSRIAPPSGWRTGRLVNILRGQYINHTAELKERVSARPSMNGDRWIVKVFVYTEAGQPTSVLTELAQSSLELIVA